MCRGRHCIVEKEEEGGRHVVLYDLSHHSSFFYVDLFYLVLREEGKFIDNYYIKKFSTDGIRMNGIRRLLLYHFLLFFHFNSGNHRYFSH